MLFVLLYSPLYKAFLEKFCSTINFIKVLKVILIFSQITITENFNGALALVL